MNITIFAACWAWLTFFCEKYAIVWYWAGILRVRGSCKVGVTLKSIDKGCGCRIIITWTKIKLICIRMTWCTISIRWLITSITPIMTYTTLSRWGYFIWSRITIVGFACRYKWCVRSILQKIARIAATTWLIIMFEDTLMASRIAVGSFSRRTSRLGSYKIGRNEDQYLYDHVQLRCFVI